MRGECESSRNDGRMCVRITGARVAWLSDCRVEDVWKRRQNGAERNVNESMRQNSGASRLAAQDCLVVEVEHGQRRGGAQKRQRQFVNGVDGWRVRRTPLNRRSLRALNNRC